LTVFGFRVQTAEGLHLGTAPGVNKSALTPTEPAPDVPERTLAEQLFRRISEAIIHGDFPAGSKISEPALAIKYGVSRGPLREALYRLQERRLVTRIPHVGARVATLSSNVLQEIFIAREALEGMAAHEAARNGTVEEIAAIRAIHDSYVRTHEAGVSDPRSYIRGTADADFHYLVAQASHNPTLISLLCSDLDLLLRFYRSRLRDLTGRVPRILVEHARIVEAIEERDSAMAELHMRRHIAAAREALTALIDTTESNRA
jgi:DNA-binding GntR family transcriptional regulator